MPWIDRSPLEYPPNNADQIRRFQDTRPPTNADYKQFRVGDLWLDTSSTYWWILSYRDSTMGIWRQLAYVPGNLDFLTGDAGGAVGPDGLNNINILGGAGITTTGNPVTNTITVSLTGGGGAVDNVITDDANNTTPDGAGNIYYLGDTGAYLNGVYFFGDPVNNTISARDLRNITVYVVDPTALETEYQTIQAALDAANAAGGGTVWIRPGTYTEDLVLYDSVDLVGAVAAPVPLGTTTIIVGQHIPPLAGAFSIRNIALVDADSILERNGAGTTVIALIDCTFDVTNGTAINLPNWTGTIATLNCHSIGTIDSYANIGAGGAAFLALGCTIGIGAGLAVFGGVVRINDCNIVTAITLIGSAIGNIRSATIQNPIVTINDSTLYCSDSNFISDDQTFINHVSTGMVTLTNLTIDTNINPGFAITGTGIVIMHNVAFMRVSAIDPGITQQANEYEVTGPTEIIPNDSSDVTEDAWIKFNIPAVMGYSLGIDNSDNDKLKITDGIDPSNGNEIVTVDPTAANAITFNAAYTFPTTDGLANQVLSTNGAGVISWASAVTNQVVIQTFTSNGNYVPTVGMQYCIIEIIGGGGAGGGCRATGGTTFSSAAGGSAGEYARGVFSAAAVGALQAVTIGVGGVGASGATGGNGGNSSVGALISANGGLGGTISATFVPANGATVFGSLGGTGGAGGDFRTPGSPSATINPLNCLYMGIGASSQYGAGGLTNNFNINGASGLGYGAGGAGTANTFSQAARTGGNGSAGIVIITEYI